MEKKEIKNEILESIKSGRIKMKPQWFFVLTGALFIVGIILVLCALLLLTSFIFFSINQSGIGFGPGFGARGTLIFFEYLPWTLIGLSVVFIIILEILVRRYSFGFKNPLLFSLLAILLIVIAGGIAAAPLHKEPFKRASENNPPFAGSFYREFMPEIPADVNKAEFIGTFESGFIVKNDQNEELSVFLPELAFSQLKNNFEPGDNMIIFGRRDLNEIQAFGVKKIY